MGLAFAPGLAHNARMYPLDDLQQDALIEAFNVGIGQAAASLSDIVREPVRLSVLSVRLVPFQAACQQLGAGSDERICAVSQTFSGAFDATGLLIFPEPQSLEVVRLMLNTTLSLEALTELEQDAMSEIGNILLNACTGAVAQIFASRLNSSLPRYQLGTPAEILAPHARDEADLVMLLHIDLLLERRQLRGVIAFMLNGSAMERLVAQIDRYLASLRLG